MIKTIFSIIIPVFNREQYLPQTILSVVNQTFQKWELILVDDGSTDRSVDICKEWCEKDDRIRFFERENLPKGGSVCRNIGMKNATGDYLLFLDSDDLLAKYCLQQRYEKILEFPELDFLVFPMLLFRYQLDDMRVLQNIPTEEDPLLRFLKRENVWLMSSPVWKRSSFIALGGFRENYLSYQDWELNVRALIENYSFRFFNDLKPDNFYRQNQQSVSGNRYSAAHNASNSEMILEIWNLLIQKDLYLTEGRNALAGFLADVLHRYRFSDVSASERKKAISLYLKKAEETGLIVSSEISALKKYLYWSDSKPAFRFAWFRKRLDKKYRGRLLSDFFTIHERQQLKHYYKGSLDEA